MISHRETQCANTCLAAHSRAQNKLYTYPRVRGKSHRPATTANPSLCLIAVAVHVVQRAREQHARVGQGVNHRHHDPGNVSRQATSRRCRLSGGVSKWWASFSLVGKLKGNEGTSAKTIISYANTRAHSVPLSKETSCSRCPLQYLEKTSGTSTPHEEQKGESGFSLPEWLYHARWSEKRTLFFLSPEQGGQRRPRRQLCPPPFLSNGSPKHSKHTRRTGKSIADSTTKLGCFQLPCQKFNF